MVVHGFHLKSRVAFSTAFFAFDVVENSEYQIGESWMAGQDHG
jgi:hypothetical protein